MSLTKAVTQHPPLAPFWRLPKVLEFTALSRSTILRKVDRKEFPKPVKLSENSVAWSAAEVQQWAADRIAARDKAA